MAARGIDAVGVGGGGGARIVTAKTVRLLHALRAA